MSAVLSRIMLRYVAGAFVAKGLLGVGDVSTLLTDPDVTALVEMAIGAGIALATESAYALAKRLGWRT
ncbi:MAG TPA: hypothetical protein VNS34_04185 [Rhizobiaceae bacterium]|nr:hypothetical protein [Rhizobiaceae bacterium]